MTVTECDHGLTVDTCADCQRLPAHEAPADLADCRSCGAPVIWTVTERGKRMPVDAEPVWGGEFVIGQEGDIVRAIYDRRDGDCLRHKSHFATCDQPDKWRRS